MGKNAKKHVSERLFIGAWYLQHEGCILYCTKELQDMSSLDIASQQLQNADRMLFKQKHSMA